MCRLRNIALESVAEKCDRRTDRRTDGRTDRRTDRRTDDRQSDPYVSLYASQATQKYSSTHTKYTVLYMSKMDTKSILNKQIQRFVVSGAKTNLTFKYLTV